MLRKRSRTTSSRQAQMVMSPTSILDSKPFSALKLNSRGIGLGLVDVLIDEKSDPNLSKPESRMVLFGSQLKIQIPPLFPPLFPSVFSPSDSPKSPADFGIKTRNSQLCSFSSGLSPSSTKKSLFGSSNSGLGNSISLSPSEMELSEDYTCVISRGPNPRTTHIFDDCIVESCCGVVGFSGSRNQNGFVTNQSMSYPSESFLTFCYNCKKNLGQGMDIYMYRGEKAFCSSECRYREIMSDERMENLEPYDV